jgi:zinc and cadmium transporter
MAWVPTLASVVLVSLVSLVGAFLLLTRGGRRHVVLLLMVAFAAGTLFGDAFLHLLPEAVAHSEQGFNLEVGLAILGGFVAFFLLEVGLRWRHSHGEAADPHIPAVGHAGHAHDGVAPFAWTNLIGDALHNFVDGVLIATSYLVDFKLGIATTIAVAAHEIPQELGDFAVLLKAGIRPGRAILYNLGSALIAVLGAVLVLLLPLPSDVIEHWALPLIAGGFIYIAAADLIPELHHHLEGRYVPVILAGLLAGLGVMTGLLFLEAPH